MATDTESSSVSGGLLVILGIIVALAIVYFFTGMDTSSDRRDINISVPNVSAPDRPAAPANNPAPPADTVTE